MELKRIRNDLRLSVKSLEQMSKVSGTKINTYENKKRTLVQWEIDQIKDTMVKFAKEEIEKYVEILKELG